MLEQRMNDQGFYIEDTGGNNNAYSKCFKRSSVLITKKDDTVAPETEDDPITVTLLSLVDQASGEVLFSRDYDKAIYFINNSELACFLQHGIL